jgi:alginate O-acetyltransferase complex protein AlgJ
MSGHQLTREQVARIELGKTEIRPWLARVMMVVFLATTVLPSGLQLAVGMVRRQSPAWPSAPAGTPTLAALPSPDTSIPGLPQGPQIRTLADLIGFIPSARQLRDFEDRLNETSLITRALAPWVGWVIKGALRGGDEQAYFGRDGWLFYRQSVDSVTGPGFLTSKWRQERLRTADPSSPLPQPDPLKALVRFHRQLASRGIALVVIPTTGKETLYPEKLAPRWNSLRTAAQNASFDTFKSELAKAGVSVFDPTPVLVEMKTRSGEDVYLKTDTHWAPSTMEEVAKQLATGLRSHGLASPSDSVNYQIRKQTVRSTGDIATMLNLPKHQRFFPPETVQTTRVLTDDRRPWEPDVRSPVLLIGDSFCNIYSLAEMGWGDSAGFAEHLSLALGQPIDRLVINAGGAYTARQELVRQLAAGRDRLAGKRVVLYQFAARELAFGDWKLFDLPTTSRPPVETSIANGELVVQGRLGAIGRLPQPGSVPYKDCLVAIHLTQVRGPSPGALEEELLVYALGMRDNRWLPVSSVPVGASVRCRLRDWAQVEKQYGSYNRAELDDLDLLSLPTFWAEEVAR